MTRVAALEPAPEARRSASPSCSSRRIVALGGEPGRARSRPASARRRRGRERRHRRTVERLRRRSSTRSSRYDPADYGRMIELRTTARRRTSRRGDDRRHYDRHAGSPKGILDGRAHDRRHRRIRPAGRRARLKGNSDAPRRSRRRAGGPEGSGRGGTRLGRRAGAAALAHQLRRVRRGPNATRATRRSPCAAGTKGGMSSESGLNEALALRLFERAGEPAERFAFATLAVNGGRPSCVCSSRSPTGPSRRTHFEHEGVLYKALSTGSIRLSRARTPSPTRTPSSRSRARSSRISSR